VSFIGDKISCYRFNRKAYSISVRRVKNYEGEEQDFDEVHV